ncbi:DUF885 family protein [Pseudochryseolinea flava]|uniref:DUF885 domain-containing protein n=1 Tax=Pseudochryseolinea flava TaxID=2059302 RepID=A0A364Y8V3_9BACT|nr:DUF885 family protein [Pseudochryseolinea flava]RAW02280.1 DUF885 domain-containing protein [Pseudochryseolinea flava]
MRFHSYVIFYVLCCFTFSAHAQEVEVMITRYTKDREALYRKYPVTESAGYYDRFIRYQESFAKELKSVNFDALQRTEQIDFILLKNQVEKDLYFLRLDQAAFNEISAVLDFAGPLYDFIDQRKTGKKFNSDVLAKTFDDVNRACSVKRTTLLEQPFKTWQQAAKASAAVNSLRDGIQEAYKFYSGYDPQFSWWMEMPQSALDTTLAKYSAFLKQHYAKNSIADDGSGIVGKPIGREAIIKSLQTEFIPYSPEELIAIAQKQFEWCDQEMLKASEALGFGKDWKLALEKVKKSYVSPGDQPAMVAGLAEDAIKFLEDRDLITIPILAKETWRMRMMSPEAQKINPFFLGGEEIIISYPTNTMTHREKMMSMRGNNPHFSKATVHHELIPGHHLQDFMQKRYKPYRYVFETPFWIEGWALYWEMNLWDKGFAQSPEDRIGMLFWRMHRCARIIFSLSYHLEKMSPQQCIDFLVTRVGHEYANAEAEVRRSFTGGYGPLYQIAYMIGGLQIASLKKELVSTGKMTEKQFHDRVLKENCIPIEVLRLILTDEKCNADYKTKWRFAEVK